MRHRLAARRSSTVNWAWVFPRGRPPDVLAWERKLVDDGRVTDGETLALTIELLDAAMKTVLATVTLGGCSLVACDEAPLGA